MRHCTEDYIPPCGCRSAGECDHGAFAWKASLDALVHDFARAMRAKLISKFMEGYSGWDDPEWSVEDIKASLLAHLEKGDPVDIANFAAFWWNRLDAPSHKDVP